MNFYFKNKLNQNFKIIDFRKILSIIFKEVKITTFLRIWKMLFLNYKIVFFNLTLELLGIFDIKQIEIKILILKFKFLYHFWYKKMKLQML